MSSFNSFVSTDVIPVTVVATANLVTDLPANGIIECTGAGGFVVVMTGAGNVRTYPITVGSKLTCVVTKVFSTAEGTTATGLYLYPI